MSWHFKFVALDKEEIKQGVNAHMAMVDSDWLCSLTTKMHEAVKWLKDNDGIYWVVESFGHVGAQDGCNFSFTVEPITSAKHALNVVRKKEY